MDICEIPTIYINLERRPDRNEHIVSELKKININNPIRFNAVEKENGALGCSFSHIKCIENAKKSDYDYVFICEDDLQILDVNQFLENINKFLKSNIEWDVVLVAGNNMLPYIPVNEYSIKIFNCITTTGYIVKKHYYDRLLANYKEGVLQFMKNPGNKSYTIDKYWLKLQMMDNWYMIIPPTIIQKEDYSDIEKKVTNFRNYMLNYNKVIIK
jgi:glycosyl transferase family 25